MQTINNKEILKLYRFRSLSSCKELYRIKEIIKNNSFHCSRFSELNDGMEGMFSSYKLDTISKVYSDKNKYKICSFTHEDSLYNPLMWGYYANSYKGIAIEIEINKNEIKKWDALNEEHNLENFFTKIQYDKKEEILNAETSTIKILSSKEKNWEHEDEYRFFTKNYSSEYKFNITNVIIGDPYSWAINQYKITDSKKHTQYKNLQKQLISFLKKNKLNFTMHN